MLEENDDQTFYESDSEGKKEQTQNKPYIMDPDHRLLLRNTKPLLQSRNTAVSQTDTRIESTHIWNKDDWHLVLTTYESVEA